MPDLSAAEAEGVAATLRACARALRSYASRSQPSVLGITAEAGPHAWHAAREPQIDKAGLLSLAQEADAAAERLGAPG